MQHNQLRSIILKSGAAARRRGYIAYAAEILSGVPESAPYPRGSYESLCWRIGWLAAMMDDAQHLSRLGLLDL